MLELTLDADAPVDAAGAVVRSAAQAAGLAADRATRLRAVVEELVRESRAREAAAGDEAVVVTAEVVGHRLRAGVADRRLPLAPGASRNLPSRRLAAMGFVDRLHIGSRGAEGNLAECDVDLDDPESSTLEGSEVLPADVGRVDDAAAAALVVRPFEPADAPGVARCVYRCYGYTYLDPLLYRPARVRHAVRSGLLHPVVAVDPAGEVVGHCALTFDRPGDPVPEGGKLVVDPRYRGHHLAERLAEVRAQVAGGLGVPGIWFECVTNHPYSQKEVLAGGGVETGLLIGATPAAIHMEALANDPVGRHALLTMWTRVAGTPPATLHLPARHHELAGSIAAAAGSHRSLAEGAPPDTTGDATRVDLSITPATSVAHLRARSLGADLLDVVRDELDGLRDAVPAVVHLDLGLTDPAAGWAVTELERLGFAWGALLVGAGAGGGAGAGRGGGDVLRLQRVEDRHVAVDHIECASAHGEAVRDHVLAEWRRVAP